MLNEASHSGGEVKTFCVTRRQCGHQRSVSDDMHILGRRIMAAGGSPRRQEGRNPKSETRNPKQIQITKKRNSKHLVHDRADQEVLDIPSLALGICFGFRASDFGFLTYPHIDFCAEGMR
jgi:hypothetical protein